MLSLILGWANCQRRSTDYPPSGVAINPGKPLPCEFPRPTILLAPAFMPSILPTARKNCRAPSCHAPSQFSHRTPMSSRKKRSACHALRMIHKVQNAPVIKKAAPLRIQANQVQRVFKFYTRFGKYAAQDKRHKQNRRPHIEAEFSVSMHRRFTAQPGIGFKEHDAVAAARRRTSCRQTA